MNNMETENIDTTSIKNLADGLSPKTRAKVMKMYADGTIGEVYDDTGEEVVGTRRKPTQN
jgi:peptide methionine sulfoxide reductase MsrB